jgi:Tol biopolymer transport system component
VIFDGILNRTPVSPLELNPSLPPKLNEIILTALEKDRDLRYQSAAEMRAELKRLKRDASSSKVAVASVRGTWTKDPSGTTAAAAPARSRKIAVAVIVTTVIIAAAVVLTVRYLATREKSFNLQNMKIVQVTNTGNAGAAALSPDRRYIVYVLSEGALQSLWVQQLATGSNVQVLPPDQVTFRSVSFTPDGNYIMFARSDKSTTNFRYLYQMPVLGGSPKQLIRDIDSPPSFSPDGKQFAFSRGIVRPAAGNNIMIANADGSGERVLTLRQGSQAGAMTVSWSPDGKTLAVISPEPRDNAQRWVLEAVSVKTGEVRDIHAFVGQSSALAWLPDSSGLFVAGTDLESKNNRIWFVSYPKGEVKPFTNDLTNYNPCCLDISRDGGSLTALQNTVIADIWVSNADGSNPRQITSGESLSSGLDWVGNRIVAGDSRAQWFGINPDGGARSQLFLDREIRFQLNACPDSKHLVYSMLHNGAFELWRSDADGSNQVRLQVHSLGGSSCAPDSRTALFWDGDAVQSVSLDGGTPERSHLSLAGFSPDGKLILEGSTDETTFLSKWKVVRVGGGAPLYSFDAPFGMRSQRFTPDGKAVAYLLTRDLATNIWEQPVAGGNPVQLTHFSSGEIFAFGWSKDGKQLAISRGQRKTDVVMMTNFR